MMQRPHCYRWHTSEFPYFCASSNGGDFGYTSLDLGIFTQSLSSAVHSRLFYNTVEWQLYGAPSHFGVHFQPVMFLLALPLRLFPSPKTLLVLQSLFLGVSVYLAYLIAKGPLGEGRALALAGLYAINSSLIGINLFEFHPVSLAVPLFLLAALFLERGKRRAFYLTSALILSVKEDAFLGVAALSLWWALRDGTGPERLRASKDLILVALISMVYGVLAIKLIIPHFGGAYLYSGLYSHPSIGREELLYFLIFNLSFGLLPLFRASNAILLAPPWMESLLPHRWSQFTIGFHYPYMLVPLSFIGAVESLKELDWRRVAVPLLAVGLLTSAVTMPVTEMPPKGMNPLIHCSVFRPIPGSGTAWKVVDAVRRTNLSVYTQPAFYPALAVKTNVYVYPMRITPDLVLVDIKTYHGRLYLQRLWRRVKAKYVLVYSKNGIELYARAGLKLPITLKELD